MARIGGTGSIPDIQEAMPSLIDLPERVFLPE